MITFGEAHWAELIQPHRWAGAAACPPRRQSKVVGKSIRHTDSLGIFKCIIFGNYPTLYLLYHRTRSTEKKKNDNRTQKATETEQQIDYKVQLNAR